MSDYQDFLYGMKARTHRDRRPNKPAKYWPAHIVGEEVLPTLDTSNEAKLQREEDHRLRMTKELERRRERTKKRVGAEGLGQRGSEAQNVQAKRKDQSDADKVKRQGRRQKTKPSGGKRKGGSPGRTR